MAVSVKNPKNMKIQEKSSDNAQYIKSATPLHVDENEIENTLKLLKKKIRYSAQKDIVLVLGNTNSGKTIFTRFITDTDDDLTAVEDKNKLIIKDVTDDALNSSTAQVFFPKLVIDTKTSTAFYDFPGFNTVQSAAQEIAKTYFMKKVIDSADKVKLVFTISYSSDTKAMDKQDFASLIKHVVTLIDNVNKFKNSIALIVTKVDNEHKENELLTEEEFKEKITDFLRNVRSDYLKRLKAKDRSKYDRKAVEFINILLKENDQDYKNIGIFKRPSNLVKLREDKLLQKNKESLKKIVHKNIKPIKHNKDDFKYTLPSSSKIYLRRLRTKIENDIVLDLENIAQEVQRYYENQEETLNDIDSLHDTFVLGYKTWSNAKEALALKGLTKSRKLVDIITQSANDSHMSISNSNLLNIENNIGYLNFIEAVKNRTMILKSLESSKSLVNVVEYLNNSRKWYNVLIKLNIALSEYGVQRFKDGYAQSAIDFKHLIEDENSENNIDVEYIINYLNFVSNGDFTKELRAIENLKLNKYKLYLLNKTINSTLLHKVKPSCYDDNKLTIQGNYVKLQDIDQAAKEVNCSNPKSIKIFASNTVFIDTDFDETGEQVQLSIIAPTWEIIDTREIILDGMPAKTVSLERARDGKDSHKPRDRNGEDGKPGKPGGSSGRFIGIGKTFINDKNLRISVNGGKGGPGQDGGNGHKGVDGTTPENKSRDFYRDQWNPCNVKSDYLGLCYLYGKNCTDGGNGGDGGAGGKGGFMEKVILITLENDSKVQVNNTDGEKGTDGMGGMGNIEGKHGKNLRMHVEPHRNWALMFDAAWLLTDLTYIDNPKCNAGKNGTNGMNTVGMEESVVVDMEAPTTIINDYKNYVWENIDNNVREKFLKEFIKDLENHKITEDLYDTPGFVNEMQNLENLFYKSSKKSEFLPLYQSLLRRVNHYANKPIFKTDAIKKDEKLKDYLKVLNYLSAATQSKINSLKYHNADILVLNLPHYLKSVEDEFNQFKDLNNIASIHKFNKDYQKSIEGKSNEAQMFIKNEITPEIDRILKEIDDGIDELINDTISRQKKVLKEKEDLVNSRQDLQNKFVIKSLLGVAKTVSQFLSIAGPFGVAAGTAMSVGANIGETLFLNDKDSPLYEKVSELPAAVTNSISSIADKLKDKKDLFKEQIADLEKELNNIEGDDRREIEQKLSDAKNIVDPETSGELSSDLESANKISEIRNEVSDLVKKKTDSIKARKAESSKNDKQFETLENMQKILKMNQVTLDCYKKIRSDQEKIEQVSSAIIQKEEDLKQLEIYENDIYEILIPMCDDIRKTADETQRNAKGKSHAALDITKWKVQNSLKDFKRKITKMTEDYNVQEDLIHFMEKLNEAITTMMVIYDRIQDNQDRADFAKYIANLNANGVQEISNETLKAEVDQLMLITQRNIILDKYATVVKAFGQYIYPFADRYLSGYNLSTDHKPEDIDTLVQNATALIHDLKGKLANIENLYTDEDEDIFPHVIYSKAISKPFFTWNYEEYKKEITQLLSGNGTFIKSDIKRGHRDNAIKFKDIGIRFRLGDESLQPNFDKVISNFRIIMTHFGNSYYKCGDDIHVITTRSVTFKHTLGTDNVHGNNDDYKNGNNAHDKFYKNVPLLSPYAMWRMELKYIGYDYESDFEILQKYVNQPMDIELEGAGRHVDDDSTVCLNGNLNKYYTLDETLSGSNNTSFPKSRRNKGGLHRKRRSLDEHLNGTEKKLFTTSGASNGIKSTLLNNIANVVGSSLIAFEYLNPVNKISQWFNKRDKNFYEEDSIKLENNVIATMELLNIPPAHAEWTSISKTLIDNESPVAEDVLFNSSLFCNNNNLLLLDLLIRRKSGVKYEKGNLKVNKNLDSEYAQSLAYKNQLSK